MGRRRLAAQFVRREESCGVTRHLEDLFSDSGDDFWGEISNAHGAIPSVGGFWYVGTRVMEPVCDGRRDDTVREHLSQLFDLMEPMTTQCQVTGAPHKDDGEFLSNWGIDKALL